MKGFGKVVLVLWFGLLLLACLAVGVKGAPWRADRGVLPASTCAKVRAGVALVGPVQALQWAREQGYSSTQIRRARKCLVATKGE